MNLTQLLFGFNGRIRRTNYWLAAIGAGFVVSAVFWILIFMIGGGAALAMRGNADASGAAGAGLGIVGFILILAYLVAMMWIGLALQIKRWHDRDKGGVWVLINLIPFIGGIWALIECGFMDGTMGPNRFGPSPKGITGPAPTAAASAGPAAPAA
jgi:uncharacterized membrane protein YhaH (DUF805 family)